MCSDFIRYLSPLRVKPSCSVLRRTICLASGLMASVSAQPLDSPATKTSYLLLSSSLGILALAFLVAALSLASGSLGSIQMATPVTGLGVALGLETGIGLAAIVTEFLILSKLVGSSTFMMAAWAVGSTWSR